LRYSIHSGWFYTNEVWFSDAYQSLTPKAKELLHCLLNELRWSGKGKKKRYTNNGEVSFTEVEFNKAYGCCSKTYVDARDQLIRNGLIKQTYRGGMCRGDRAKYKILAFAKLPRNEERWRLYPEMNWEKEIPKQKKQLVGVKTQWKKGKSGRKLKTTLQNYTLNGGIPPKKVDP
jgi:hypothetical protein